MERSRGPHVGLRHQHSPVRPFRARAWQLVVGAMWLFSWPLSGLLAGSPPDKSGVKPSVISLPSGAGSIEGLGESFQPQLNSGGATYGMAIQLPPGRTGLVPSVRLSYNSNLGNGLCGLGWNLEFPSIRRQTDKGFPSYTSGDTFVFQGEDLVPLDNPEADWRCENERAFQRFRQVDADSDGQPDSWEMTDRDGTRHTFGRHHGASQRWSAIEHPDRTELAPFDRTFAWMLDSTVDLHGNRIDYEYIRGQGVLYPSRIVYSRLDDAFHEVAFTYETRPDVFDDFRPTFSARVDRRLTKIEVRTSGEMVRAYAVQYDYLPGDLTSAELARRADWLDLGVSLLKRVVQFDTAGVGSNYLPPLVFSYSGFDLANAQLRTVAQAPDLDLADPTGRVQLADLDGDGLPDLFGTLPAGASHAQFACLNRGEIIAGGPPQLAFAAMRQAEGASPVDLGQPETVIHDAKGKGLVDVSTLVAEGGDKRLESYENRSRLDIVNEGQLGFALEHPESVRLPSPPAFVGFSQAGTRLLDVNFDKRSDFVNLEPSLGAMKVNVYFRARGGTWTATESLLPSSYPLSGTFADQEGAPNPHVHLADLNGDRLQDLIYLNTDASGGGIRLRISYWPLRGAGHFDEERILQTASGDTFDLGQADLSDVFLEDVTGDGLADVLLLDGSSGETLLTVRVNLGGVGWSAPYRRGGLPAYRPRESDQPTIVRWADLNGNGSVDLLFRNPASATGWQYLEFLPGGKASLLTQLDNSLGKRTTIVYGSSIEDEQRARAAGHPWRTHAPFPLQVLRQLRVATGQDLNGDGHEDVMVSEFRYRDAFYDGLEREFRGFAFAERIDYGDDLLFDPGTGGVEVAAGWDQSRTPTGQVSGPSLITRYRYHTGANDQIDNDDYGDTVPAIRLIDELTEVGGREEEVLKGVQLAEEKVDAAVLHAGAGQADFDAGCAAASTALTDEERGRLTPDAFVYTRTVHEWKIRRLYRPAEPVPYFADQNANGLMEDYRLEPLVPVPAGRFAAQGINVLSGEVRSVSFAFLSRQRTEVLEANGVLGSALGYPVRAGRTTERTFDYDDYGNATWTRDYGLTELDIDDERFTHTTYALAGQALTRWIVNKPDTIDVTDEQGTFVSRKVHYYDGEPFVGQAGSIGERALLSRTTEFIDAEKSIQATRSRYDAFGNVVESRDPVGNVRQFEWDPSFRTFPVRETVVVGAGSPDLVMTASYHYGFGVLTHAVDFNGNPTSYGYDSFGRLVYIVRPGDTEERPTQRFDYQPADPGRGRAFIYDPAGTLTVIAVPLGSLSRVITRHREQAGTDNEFVTATFTDGAGRSVATLEEGATAGTWVVKKATSFNLRNASQADWQPYSVASAEIPHFPALWPSGNPPTRDANDRLTVATSHHYDATGRNVRDTLPPESAGGSRRERATVLLPFEQQVFDEEDARPGSIYHDTPHVQHQDGLGRLIAVDEVVRLTDEGRPGPRSSWRTQYGYDLNDQLTLIIDSQGNRKTFRFDGLKRKIHLNDPDRGEMIWVYDDASNIREIVDAKGQVVKCTYDGVNRLRTEDYLDENQPGSAGWRFDPTQPISATNRADVVYFYDAPFAEVEVGNGTTLTPSNTRGLVSAVWDLTGEEHRSYDARGRVSAIVKRIKDPVHGRLVSYRTAFDYDSLDRATQLTYPDDDRVGLSYNARSLLDRISGGMVIAALGTSNLLSGIDYESSGQLARVAYGNGVRTTYDYDPRLRLRTLKTLSDRPAPNTELIHFAYEFDGAGNILHIRDQRPAATVQANDPRRNTQVFQYDDLYRITRADYSFAGPAAPLPGETGGVSNGHIAYRYDRIGNMLEQSSNIDHVERGQSVTDLGTMDSGGAAGRSNRAGRTPSDPPGPHALTQIRNQNSEIRNYPYDSNGNMLVIDGITNIWDFKDRLVRVESAAMVADYAYDYTDRRITKHVRYKSPATGSGNPKSATLSPQSDITLYIDKHFEVRPGNEATKYIWNGDTRVARITTHLSPGPKVQRMPYAKGWNLASSFGGDSVIPAHPDLNLTLRWNAVAAAWTPVLMGERLAAGSVLWLHTEGRGTLVLRGEPTTLGDRILNGRSFQAGWGALTLPVADSLPATVDAWLWDADAQSWRPRLAGVPEDSDHPARLDAGGAFFASSHDPVTLPAPAQASTVRFYHQDHLGSTSVVTDGDGRLVEESAYYAFGHKRHTHGDARLHQAFAFTQREQDDETSLIAFDERYSASILGRFLSCDPLAVDPKVDGGLNPQSQQTYSYCGQRPTVMHDPTGCSEAPGPSTMTEFAEGGGSNPPGLTCTDVTIKGGAELVPVTGGDLDLGAVKAKSNLAELKGDGKVKVCSDGTITPISFKGRIEAGGKLDLELGAAKFSLTLLRPFGEVKYTANTKAVSADYGFTLFKLGYGSKLPLGSDIKFGAGADVSLHSGKATVVPGEVCVGASPSKPIPLGTTGLGIKPSGSICYGPSY